MQVLVTGGCGFIGSHLVKRLTGLGYEVRVLDDLSTGRADQLEPAATLICGNVAEPAALEMATKDVSAIFHLAAIASVARCTMEWQNAHRINQTGTIAVLDAARNPQIPVIYASSAAVYGDAPGDRVSEAVRPQPLSAYGVDKFGSELHAQIAARHHDVSSVGLRFFNVFGPGQRADSPYSGVISLFADRVNRGEPIQIHGTGQQTRDFVHVQDVVTGLILALDRCLGRTASGEGKRPDTAEAMVFNICTGVPTSVATLARLVMGAAGRRVPVRRGPPRPGDILASVGDPNRARACLGFSASIDLRSGLHDLLAHNAVAAA